MYHIAQSTAIPTDLVSFAVKAVAGSSLPSISADSVAAAAASLSQPAGLGTSREAPLDCSHCNRPNHDVCDLLPTFLHRRCG
ncbi:OLC1v1030504C1 [Oldenlandia corymbosa var. corymbosa]|uniref:OLC1v1030504C1 n=1 Tax=Oldenlandia corymbosa var. corymbosa TaxID=529605 RepID=A0AAV1CH21_OLDCO|nr:OLC1v1030504C1 [Oldenlandia corymbosa var. corymbosa]